MKNPSSNIDPDTIAFSDHAEAWYREQGEQVPARGTSDWDSMYAAWVEYAFSDLHGRTNNDFYPE